MQLCLRNPQFLESEVGPVDAELSPGCVIAQLAVRLLLLRREALLKRWPMALRGSTALLWTAWASCAANLALGNVGARVQEVFFAQAWLTRLHMLLNRLHMVST